MLYLPSIRYSESDVRLPSPSADIVSICAAMIEAESFQQTVRQILSQNPCLLLLGLAKYQREECRLASNFVVLIEWMRDHFFFEELEYEAFEAAAPLSVVQQAALAKYLSRRNRKRLAKFVSTVSQLNASASKEFVDSFVSKNFFLRRK